MNEANQSGRRGPRDLVVLLHGLSRTRFSLWRMERALRAAGYATLNWRYASRRHSIPELIEQFSGLLKRLPGGPTRIHFVGHSLGAILVRAGLSRPTGLPIGRIVLLAPPNRGARVVSALLRVPFLPRLFGRPTAELGRDAAWLMALGVPKADLGIVAGTRRLHPFNPTSWLNAVLRNPGPHDGTVEADSTKLTGMRDYVTVDATHTFICDHPEAIRQTLAFLATGAFQHRR